MPGFSDIGRPVLRAAYKFAVRARQAYPNAGKALEQAISTRVDTKQVKKKAVIFRMKVAAKRKAFKEFREADWRVEIPRRWNHFKVFDGPAKLNKLHRHLTMPFSIFFLTYSAKVHPSYGMTQWKRIKLASRFAYNNVRMTAASSYRAHLVMAMKLLELPPETKGAVVECGCFKGAMTVNLSVVCKIAGRKLIVYDSFEGLPPPTSFDFWPSHVPYMPGVFKGALHEVKSNVTRLGEIDVCDFRKGWFKDTLPHHQGDVVMAVVDVDYHSSLYDCVTMLWPHLVDRGYFFIDEYVFPDYCALFYSEKFWKTHFDQAPPGLIGAGSGVGVGEYYIGPWKELWMSHNPASIAYTRKGERALWEYYPNEEPAVLGHAKAANGGE
jgi:O-methyltransferase